MRWTLMLLVVGCGSPPEGAVPDDVVHMDLSVANPCSSPAYEVQVRWTSDLPDVQWVPAVNLTALRPGDARKSLVDCWQGDQLQLWSELGGPVAFLCGETRRLALACE